MLPRLIRQPFSIARVVCVYSQVIPALSSAQFRSLTNETFSRVVTIDLPTNARRGTEQPPAKVSQTISLQLFIRRSRKRSAAYYGSHRLSESGCHLHRRANRVAK